jgi:hypothetical protein
MPGFYEGPVHMLRAAGVLLLIALLSSSLQAQARDALLIGNQAYDPYLTHPAGVKHRARQRKGQTMALPEPLAAGKKRLWGIWLDWALQRADRLYMVPLGLYFLFAPILVLTDLFGGKAMERQLDSLMLAKFGPMVLLGLFAMLVILPITLARGWLRTKPGTRLCRAQAWVIENEPIGFLVIAIGISAAITGNLNMAVYAAVLVTALAVAGIYWVLAHAELNGVWQVSLSKG